MKLTNKAKYRLCTEKNKNPDSCAKPTEFRFLYWISSKAQPQNTFQDFIALINFSQIKFNKKKKKFQPVKTTNLSLKSTIRSNKHKKNC